jgi:hypothetical protein
MAKGFCMKNEEFGLPSPSVVECKVNKENLVARDGK